MGGDISFSYAVVKASDQLLVSVFIRVGSPLRSSFVSGAGAFAKLGTNLRKTLSRPGKYQNFINSVCSRRQRIE